MPTVNPLNEFNTYSYHHFLILGTSTARLEALNDNDAFFRLIQGESTLDGVRVVINPLISNRYVIQEIDWVNQLSSDFGEVGATTYCDGTMKIIEPNGISFLNDLQDVVASMGTTVDGCVWAIKTIFVGDTGVGSTEIERYQYITNVKPSIVQILDVNIHFDETGGTYEFTFVLAANGAPIATGAANAAFNQNASVSLTQSDESKPATIVQALRQLEDHVNKTNDEEYAKVLLSGSRPKKQKTVITWPPELDKPEYVLSSPRRTSSGPDGTGAILSVDQGQSIIVAIHEVLKMCPTLMRESTAGKSKYLYVVNTDTITNEDTDEYKYINNYRVQKLEVQPIANPTVADGGEGDGSVSPAQQQAEQTGNFLEFDYLYTGQNLDVLEYEMKIAAGLAFFNTVIAQAGTRDDRTHSIATTYLKSQANARKSGTGGVGTFYTPVSGAASNSHLANPQAAQSYEALMQQFSALDVMTTLKIRGNPRLLNDVIPTTENNVRAQNGETIPSDGLATNWQTQPIRCKVNVRMPKDGDYDNLQDFWFKGLYRVFSVKNTFSGGEFTQELELMAELDGSFSDLPEPTPGTPPAFEPPVAVSGEPATNAARVRAFMQMLRYCEGTAKSNGYSVQFNYVPFVPGADHPRRVITANGYKSSAAGAYQITMATWDDFRMRKKYAGMMPDFLPASQDRCCWAIMDSHGALPLIRENKIEEAINILGGRWASLPSSKAGQPKRKLGECLQVYNAALAAEMNGQTTLAAGFEELV